MAKQTVTGANAARDWAHTDKRQEVPVDGAKHLYLVVQAAPSKAKSWAWRARPVGGGTMVKLTLGSIADHDYFAAVAWANGENAKRAEGVDVRAAREIERLAVRLASDRAIKAEGEQKAKTLQWYHDELYAPRYLEAASQHETRRGFTKHLLPALGSKPLNEITRKDLAGVVNKLAETAPVSANRLVNTTRTLFRRAIERFGDETGMETNPAQYLAKPYDDEHKNRKQPVLERRELGYVISAAEAAAFATTGYGAYARAIKLILATGVRRGEALGATWGEFDLDAGSWTIPAARSKNRLPHFVPLPPKLLAWLKGLGTGTKPTDYLFTAQASRKMKADAEPVYSTKPVSCLGREQDKLYAHTERLAKRDDVELGAWSPHALRRTLATTLSSLTDDELNPLVPPHVVEALLNHQSGASKAGVAGIYNKHQYHKEKAAALAIWEAHLEAVYREEVDRNRFAVVMQDALDAMKAA